MTGLSALTVALALSAGPVAAAPAGPVTAAAPVGHGPPSAAGLPAGTDPPPPEPPPPTEPPPNPPPEPPPPGPTTPDTTPSTPPSEPPETPTEPGETQGPDDTSPTGEPSGPRGDDTASSAAQQQIQAAGAVTADLDRLKDEVPGDLVPSVERLTATLRAVENPATPPQERDAVVRGARAVTVALKAVADPGTPAEVRTQLTGLVRQVATVLGTGSRPHLPQAERRTSGFVAERTASVLPVIADARTPGGLRDDLAGAASGALTAVGGTRPGHERTARGPQTRNAPSAARSVAVAASVAGSQGTPNEGRKETAQSAHQAGTALAKAEDPDASAKERDTARKELPGRIDRMEKELEKALAAEGLPDVPLGTAAEVCTDAVFDSAPEDTLGTNLRGLLPERWNAEGVKDFWKAEDKGNDVLDVLAQLRTDEYADAPVEVARLLPRLAATVPADRLFATLGKPALHCLQAARQLDERGVPSGSWVRKAEEL
ncbi:hypothetical protein [Streptomyces sp. LPB2020-019-1HS]|uniref:hypothetical protein n=1 Tax=Streptomyces sp. LPB2020-019-1HS TaxID=3409689 RepID=UPI003B6735B6